MFTTMPSSNHTHTTLTVVEQFILSREKQKPRPKLIQKPGTDMPDTIHTPTDTDTDIDTLTMHILMPTVATVPTDILMPTEDTEDIITANKFSDEYRISDMAKGQEYQTISHLLQKTIICPTEQKAVFVNREKFLYISVFDSF